jgi:hypothetical protein
MKLNKFISGIAILCLVLIPLLSTNIKAAGSATLYFKQLSGTYANGNTISIEVWENSGAELVNALQIDMVYDKAKLEYLGFNFSGSNFTTPQIANHDTVNGKVLVTTGLPGRLPSDWLSGEQFVGKIQFKVKDSSTNTNISFDSTSLIAQAPDGIDIWDGNTNGGTFGVFQNISNPKWMQLNKNTKKVVYYNQSPIDNELQVGMQLRFLSRININGMWCYRTASDHNNKINKCIPESDIMDIPFEPFITPRWMVLNTDTQKQIPDRGVAVDNILFKNIKIKFVSKITVKGQVFFRTAFDTNANNNKGIPASAVSEIQYEKMQIPRNLKANVDTFKYVPNTENPTSNAVAKDNVSKYTSKITVNNVLYLRTESDTISSTNLGVKFSELSEVTK